MLIVTIFQRSWPVAVTLLAAALGTGGCSDPPPEVLEKRVDVLPSRYLWTTDWSWDATITQEAGGGRLVANIRRHGGVAFRDAHNHARLRLPKKGYLSLVLGPERVLQVIAVSLNNGKRDLEPHEGISLLSPQVHRQPWGPDRFRISIPLGLFGPAGAPVHKINVMNRGGAADLEISEVAFLPPDEEAVLRVRGRD